MKALVVLGSLNSEEGSLGPISLDRLNYCARIFDPKEHYIVCTGGFGAHFNTTNKAHAVYAMNYLMHNGVGSERFLEPALSGNTVEDAVMTKEILLSYNLDSLIVVTSDFHLERVKLIFDEVLSFITIEYRGVEHNLSHIEKEKFLAHEKKAIDGILNKGLYY